MICFKKSFIKVSTLVTIFILLFTGNFTSCSWRKSNANNIFEKRIILEVIKEAT